MATLEKQIENSILSFLKLRGVFCWKQDTVGIFDQAKGVYRKKWGIHHLTGIADILGCFDGRLLAIEVKTLKGKLSPAQVMFLDSVNQHGGIGFVARSIDDVAEKLGIGL